VFESTHLGRWFERNRVERDVARANCELLAVDVDDEPRLHKGDGSEE
jgi:hypothetical protein